MSDDLVAELTLRIRNEMESGFEEMKSEFSGLKDSILGLNGTLTETNELLANLKTPLALEQGFKTAASEAEGMATAVADVDEAASNLAGSFTNIGTAIDEDTAKMQALLTEMYDAQAAMAQLPAEGAGATPGAPEGAGVPQDEPEGSPSQRGHGQSDHGGGFDALNTLLGLAMGVTEFKEWASYDTEAKQITVTEGLHGAAAEKEASRLKDLMAETANRYASSSEDLMSTYAFLITDSLSKATVEGMLPSLAEASTAYNVPTSAIAQAAFTLSKNLGIPSNEMGDALAILHHASMMGHFTMADFSANLPELGGQMSLMGMSGLRADVVAASALETIRKNTGTGGEAATELKEFMMYLHSPMALRMFDRTKRMEDLLGPSGEALMEKYHVEPLDLPKYLNDARAKGVDPIDALTDYFSTITSNISSPTDKAAIIGAYMHNHQAQDAMLALVQYKSDFEHYQDALSNVSDKTLADDFWTATSGASADARRFNESASQFGRYAGHAIDYLAVEPWNALWNAGGLQGPPAAQPGTGAGLQITPTIPLTVNVHVDKDGNVKVDGGVTGGPMNAPAGTSVRVDQGNVLTGVH